MSEEKYLDALSMYIDGELDADGERELEEHIAGSPDAMERLDEYRAISAGLKYPPDAPPELSGNVMASIRAAKRRRFRIRAAASVIAAAACIAVVIAVPNLMNTETADDSSQSVSEVSMASLESEDEGTGSSDIETYSEEDADLPDEASLVAEEPESAGTYAESPAKGAEIDESAPESSGISGRSEDAEITVAGASIYSDYYAVVYCEGFPRELSERDSFETPDGMTAAFITTDELAELEDAGYSVTYFSEDSSEIIVVFE